MKKNERKCPWMQDGSFPCRREKCELWVKEVSMCSFKAIAYKLAKKL